MGKNSEPEIMSDYFTYDPQKGKRVKKSNATIKNSFMFAMNEFYLMEKDGFYVVCVLKKGELYLVWKIKKGDMLAGEVISEFRKKYLQNNVTQDSLELFLDNPVEYVKKYSKRSHK